MLERKLGGERMHNRTGLIAVIVIGMLASSAMAAVQRPASRVDAVTVYPSGATVTRIADVVLTAGRNDLHFGDLSVGLDRDRIQVEVLGDGVDLGHIRWREVVQREAVDAAVRNLQAQIDALQSRLVEIDDSISTAELKWQFLQGIAQGYAKESWFEGARGQADIESWRGAMAVLEEGGADARAVIRANRQQRTQVERELSEKQRELQQLQGQQRVSLELQVALTAARAQPVQVLLHYYQAQAGWFPQTTVRVDSESGDLRLLQQAQVRQQTDEVWDDVALTLSTSEPTGTMQAPDVPSQFLELRDPANPAPLGADAAKLRPLSTARVLEELVMEPVAAPSPGAKIGAYAVSYSVAGRVDVDNRAETAGTFEISSQRFVAELITRVVPRISQTAYLMAKFVYDAELPLAANRTLVYVDQVFVGESWMPAALPQDELTLPLGQDRRVAVTVRDEGGRKGQQGLIGRRQQDLTAYRFTVTNRHRSANVIEVLDYYPTAVDAEIRVTVPRAATPPTVLDFDDKPGVVLWRATLQADESWTIAHQYELSYPADRTVRKRLR